MRQLRTLGALMLIVLTLLTAAPAVLADTAAISVAAYLDENGNGKLDEGEPTVAGGEVTVADMDGNMVALVPLGDTSLTIEQLDPGQYTVALAPAEGFAVVGQDQILTVLSGGATLNINFGLTAVAAEPTIEETEEPEPTATPQPVATATPIKIATSEPTATTARATVAPTAAPAAESQGGLARVSGILVALVALVLPLGVRMLRRP